MPLKDSLAAGSTGYPPLFLALDSWPISSPPLKYEETAIKVLFGWLAEPSCHHFCPREHIKGPRGAPDQLGSPFGAAHEPNQFI